MIPFPLFNTSARLTLSPGLPSKRVISGIESPTLTMFAVVVWKYLVVLEVALMDVKRVVVTAEDLSTLENIGTGEGNRSIGKNEGSSSGGASMAA
jgi:hypothetical protein